MSYEAFREQCAVELEKLDCAHGCGIGSEIAQKIRALPLPEVKQEHFNYKALSSKTVEQGWRDTFSVNNPYCPCDLRTFEKSVVWAERELGKQFTAILTENEQLRATLGSLSKRCYIMSESHQVNDVRGARLIVGFNNIADAGDAHSAISALKGGAA